MKQRYQSFVIDVVGSQGDEVVAGRVRNGAFREKVREVGVGIATVDEPIDLPRCGPGACRACDCRGFKATGKGNDICATCSHYWQVHR